MIYTTSGKPKRIDFSFLNSCLAFASDYLKLDDILIHIQFHKMEEYHFGFCDYSEDEIILTVNKNLPLPEIARTLFHELVHVKQYEDGRLIYNSQRWLDAKKNNLTYTELPWEVEAFELEEKMMIDFYAESEYDIL